MSQSAWYKNRYRRMLVDMHIVDWEEGFLSKYDPASMADLYERANLNAVMFYTQSHVGLCNWPTKSGKMHAGLKDRDVVGGMVEQLKKRDIASVAYYSVVFNVWAHREHPEWRIVSAREEKERGIGAGRLGVCCPNNPGYREFALIQTEELVSTYDFDGFFFDMTFWPSICVCEHCRARCREETGKEFPATLDWRDPEWCEFQVARERWMDDFGATLTAKVKSIKPDMSVYHNFATAFFDCMPAVSLSTTKNHDFLGADYYGGREEQVMVCKTMLHLSENRPAEFMTSRCTPDLRYHVRTKSYAELEMQAFASTLFSAAFLFIDAINLDGTVNPAFYDWVGHIYAKTAPYEPYLGGVPVEDIGVYYGSDAKIDTRVNGTLLEDVHPNGTDYPHLKAVRGACRILQDAHLPFGVITQRDLPRLDEYKVVILPNVIRMNSDEVDAFRNYVENGGSLFASRMTSMLNNRDGALDDFALADVFGCQYNGEEEGYFAYMRPTAKDVANRLLPQDYLCLGRAANANWGGAVQPSAVRLSDTVEGETLGRLTLPYGHPARGTINDNDWASFHSWPPHKDTDHPVLVRNQYGKGHVVYCAADIESFNADAADRLFLGLIEFLFRGVPSYSSEAHPAVWFQVTHQPEQKRFLIGCLNYQEQLPAVPMAHVPFTLRVPDGSRFTRLLRLPDEKPVNFQATEDGLTADAGPLSVFTMLVAEYE